MPFKSRFSVDLHYNCAELLFLYCFEQSYRGNLGHVTICHLTENLVFLFWVVLILNIDICFNHHKISCLCILVLCMIIIFYKDSQEGLWSMELFIYLLLFVRRTKHHARTTSRII